VLVLTTYTDLLKLEGTALFRPMFSHDFPHPDGESGCGNAAAGAIDDPHNRWDFWNYRRTFGAGWRADGRSAMLSQ